MRIVIIGNGIAGITAARRLRQKQPTWSIQVVSGESRFHYSRPALMYLFMGHMTYQDVKPIEDRRWAEWRIELVRDWVTAVDVEAKQLNLQRGPPLRYDKLLLATGSKSNRFGWPGQELGGVQGLYDLRDLRLLYESCKGARQAVIVGGGLIGIELAEMLHTRGIHVTFLVRESSYWNNILPAEESAMVNRIIPEQGMGLELETELERIVDDGSGRCAGVVTKDERAFDCQIVGLTAGVSPNLDLVRETPVETGRGVLVDWSLRTSVSDVFAAGDCAEIVREGDERNLLQQVWYTGKMQGEVVADVMAGEARRYDPGIWYNSAKFLDLEYQTYGRVNQRVPGERSLYWEHPGGRQAVRVVHVGGAVIGFNLMGVRYRHEVCERWIREERSVDWVLEHLAEANFDPEFFRRHEDEIVAGFRMQIA